jgi:hypothetical protein
MIFGITKTDSINSGIDPGFNNISHDRIIDIGIDLWKV